MEKIKMLARWFHFYRTATTRYQIHSPFVFDFLQNVFEDERHFYAFDEIENLRAQLLKDPRTIEVTDYGAGSHVQKTKQRQVAHIAQAALTDKRHGQMLFKMIHHYGLQSCLEIGTSLGLTAAYLALPNAQGQLITMEGCPNIAKIARENLHKLGIKNAQIVVGEFSETLPHILAKMQKIDFAFFDGNHRFEPTIQYFEQALEYAHEGSVFVFDDLYWSAEMQQAWKVIQHHPKTTLTIDLFFMGIVFFQTNFAEKTHYKLLPVSWKPWVMGFWSSK